MFGLGLPELIIVGIVAVMLFGKRLPEVARSFGQSYQQFRAGLRDIQYEMDQATRAANATVYEPPPAITHAEEVDHAYSEEEESNETT